jgi:DNA repair exonuclease SbcCD ATPase subunit
VPPHRGLPPVQAPPGSGPWEVAVPPPAPGTPDGPPGFAPPGEPGHHWDPLLRLLAERRPGLAERLTCLRERDPERFEDIIADAVGKRIERALDEQDEQADQERPGEPVPPPPMHAPRMGGPHHRLEMDEHARGLQEQQEKLEQQSRELAGQLRRMQREGAPQEQMQRSRDELTRIVNQQFDLRTELRKTELERLEQDMKRIQQRLDQVRQNLERRQAERAEIVARRMEQLLGEDSSGW